VALAGVPCWAQTPPQVNYLGIDLKLDSGSLLIGGAHAYRWRYGGASTRVIIDAGDEAGSPSNAIGEVDPPFGKGADLIQLKGALVGSHGPGTVGGDPHSWLHGLYFDIHNHDAWPTPDGLWSTRVRGVIGTVFTSGSGSARGIQVTAAAENDTATGMVNAAAFETNARAATQNARVMQVQTLGAPNKVEAVVFESPGTTFSRGLSMYAASFADAPVVLNGAGSLEDARIRWTGGPWLAAVGNHLAEASDIQPFESARYFDHGAVMVTTSASEELVLTGGYGETFPIIPADSQVLAVAVRVLDTITGCASYVLGDAYAVWPSGAPVYDRFRSGMPVLLAGESLVAGRAWKPPNTSWQQWPGGVRITCTDGAFTGGRVRVFVAYTRFGAPTE